MDTRSEYDAHRKIVLTIRTPDVGSNGLTEWCTLNRTKRLGMWLGDDDYDIGFWHWLYHHTF